MQEKYLIEFQTEDGLESAVVKAESEDEAIEKIKSRVRTRLIKLGVNKVEAQEVADQIYITELSTV